MSEPKHAPATLRVAAEMATMMLCDRRGHGGGVCTYRIMREEQLIAFAALAIERAAAPAMLEALRTFCEAYEGNTSARLGSGQARRSLDQFRRLVAQARGEKVKS